MDRGVTEIELLALRDKYARMLRLRELHDQARRDPSFVEPDPRAEMVRLARAFPGALRELDELPLGVLSARRDAIEAALGGVVASWIVAQVVFHFEARGVLSAKAWLGRTKTVDAATQEAFARSLGEEAPGRGWIADLAEVARPPRGRLMDLVWKRVGARIGRSPAEARALVAAACRSGTA